MRAPKYSPADGLGHGSRCHFHTFSFQFFGPLVAEHIDVELLSGHLFLFFNRRRD
ncbi:hypothetical protein [Novipirellula galeiformis]|uniref:hypothetical protein n=1 Tax=Novipirellula galeiformis TaxID=2528004 RepID=UPI0018CEA99A|nr:hypothetical protein [Novipirellula galeiformis]